MNVKFTVHSDNQFHLAQIYTPSRCSCIIPTRTEAEHKS